MRPALFREGTLRRESMPTVERAWVETNRPPAAAHWNLLTTLTAEQILRERYYREVRPNLLAHEARHDLTLKPWLEACLP